MSLCHHRPRPQKWKGTKSRPRNSEEVAKDGASQNREATLGFPKPGEEGTPEEIILLQTFGSLLQKFLEDLGNPPKLTSSRLPHP